MRWLAIVFLALIAVLQYPIWLGKGGWLQVRELERQLATQRDSNAVLKARNDRLDADVRDLKTGYEGVEERARAELGMVKQDEVFFQLQNTAAAHDLKARPASPSTDAVTASAGRPGAQ